MASIFSGFGYTPPPPPTAVKKKSELASNEVDHEQNPTKLFKRLEEKAWAPALSRLERTPNEAKIWVVRKAFDGSVTWRRLPIHQACIGNPTSKTVLTLLQCYPNSARQIDSDRRLAIHHACANGASLDVVKHLLMAHPDSINAEDIWFKTPLQTLLSNSNPDPTVVSAVKKGPQYYRLKVSEARSRMKSNKNRSPSMSSDGSVSSSYSRQSRNVIPSSASMNDRSVVTNLENELGKFSERLAASVDQENVLKKKIQELEDKNCDLDQLGTENQNLRRELENCRRNLDMKDDQLRRIESGNNDLSGDLSSMQREVDIQQEHVRRLQSENNNLKDDLNQYRQDLLSFDGVKQSEENLRRQLEEVSAEDNNRIRELESKLLSVSDALRLAESRLHEFTESNDRDLYTLKRDLKNAVEDAKVWKRKAELYKDDQGSMLQELDALRTINASHEDVTNQLKAKVLAANSEKGQMSSEMEQLDKHLFDMESKMKNETEKLKKVEEEKTQLEKSLKDLERVKSDLHDSSERLKGDVDELGSVLRDRDQEIGELKEQLYEAEHREGQRRMSYDAEYQNTNRQLEDLEEEVRRAEKKQANAEEDRDEIEKKLKDHKSRNEELETEVDNLKRKEKEITRELDDVKSSVENQIGEYKTKLTKQKDDEQLIKALNKETEEKNVLLKHQIAEVTKARDELENKLYEIHREMDNQEGEGRALRAEAMTVMAENDKFGMENKQLQDTITALLKKESDLNSTKDDLHKKVYELQRQIDSREGETMAIRSEATSIKTEKDSLYMENQQLRQETSSLLEQLTSLERGNRILKSDLMSIKTERDTLGMEHKHLQGTMSSLLDKLEDCTKEKALIQQHSSQFENMRYEFEQLERSHEQLKNAMLEEIEEKEDLEAKVGFLMEEVEKLEESNNIPSEINAIVDTSEQQIENGLCREEEDELRDKIARLQATNDSLCALIEEQEENKDNGSASSEEMNALEERLSLLEESKDKEIRALMKEKRSLENAIEELKAKIEAKEQEVQELTAANQIYANQVAAMKKKNQAIKSKKKQSLQQRLAAIESRSVSSGNSRSRRIERDNDDSSQVSGMTSLFSSTPSASPTRSSARSRLMEGLENQRSRQNEGMGGSPTRSISGRSSSRSRLLESLESHSSHRNEGMEESPTLSHTGRSSSRLRQMESLESQSSRHNAGMEESPTRSLTGRSSSRSRLMEGLDAQSAQPSETKSELDLGKFDKRWISRYKASKKKDLKDIFPSSMTVTGLSLEGSSDERSTSGAQSLYTAPTPFSTQKHRRTVSSTLKDQSPIRGLNVPNLRNTSSSKARNDIREPSPSSTRERILAILKE
jgi:chromosome segregation ATPase